MALKSAVMRSDKFRPVPDFDAPDNPGWLLLRRVLETWIQASRTPVLVFPIPHYYFVTSSSESNAAFLRR